MRVFWPHLQGSPLVIDGPTARYVSTVLRLRKGDELRLFDGSGRQLRARLISSGPRRILLEPLSEEPAPPAESPLRVRLLQGLLKADKMALLLQKATELGVAEFQPLVTQRSVPRAMGAEKLRRLRRIAQEAARQCGRAVLPQVYGPISLQECLRGHQGPGVLFWEQGGQRLGQLSVPAGGSLSLLIGPEGGLTSEEVAQARARGFQVATLGPRILRAETAALAALALVQHRWGDLG
jgi:16S rRNA (uracil1498-N3)-methyltransferase